MGCGASTASDGVALKQSLPIKVSSSISTPFARVWSLRFGPEDGPNLSTHLYMVLSVMPMDEKIKLPSDLPFPKVGEHAAMCADFLADFNDADPVPIIEDFNPRGFTLSGLYDWLRGALLFLFANDNPELNTDSKRNDLRQAIQEVFSHLFIIEEIWHCSDREQLRFKEKLDDLAFQHQSSFYLGVSRLLDRGVEGADSDASTKAMPVMRTLNRRRGRYFQSQLIKNRSTVMVDTVEKKGNTDSQVEKVPQSVPVLKEKEEDMSNADKISQSLFSLAQVAPVSPPIPSVSHRANVALSPFLRVVHLSSSNENFRRTSSHSYKKVRLVKPFLPENVPGTTAADCKSAMLVYENPSGQAYDDWHEGEPPAGADLPSLYRWLHLALVHSEVHDEYLEVCQSILKNRRMWDHKTWQENEDNAEPLFDGLRVLAQQRLEKIEQDYELGFYKSKQLGAKFLQLSNKFTASARPLHQEDVLPMDRTWNNYFFSDFSDNVSSDYGVSGTSGIPGNCLVMVLRLAAAAIDAAFQSAVQMSLKSGQIYVREGIKYPSRHQSQSEVNFNSVTSVDGTSSGASFLIMNRCSIAISSVEEMAALFDQLDLTLGKCVEVKNNMLPSFEARLETGGFRSIVATYNVMIHNTWADLFQEAFAITPPLLAELLKYKEEEMQLSKLGAIDPRRFGRTFLTRYTSEFKPKAATSKAHATMLKRLAEVMREKTSKMPTVSEDLVFGCCLLYMLYLMELNQPASLLCDVQLLLTQYMPIRETSKLWRTIADASCPRYLCNKFQRND